MTELLAAKMLLLMIKLSTNRIGSSQFLPGALHCARAQKIARRVESLRAGGYKVLPTRSGLLGCLGCALRGAMAVDVLLKRLSDNPRYAAVQVSGDAFGRVPQFVFHSQSANRCVHVAMVANTV